MRAILRASCALASCSLLLPAQGEPVGHCTGMMPAPVQAEFNAFGQQTCRVGFAGVLGDGLGLKYDNVACPVLLVVTPPHSKVQWQQGALTDARVNGQVPTHLITFRCVSHFFLFVWLYDTCEIDQIRVVGNVDNYGLVSCLPYAPATD